METLNCLLVTHTHSEQSKPKAIKLALLQPCMLHHLFTWQISVVLLKSDNTQNMYWSHVLDLATQPKHAGQDLVISEWNAT